MFAESFLNFCADLDSIKTSFVRPKSKGVRVTDFPKTVPNEDYLVTLLKHRVEHNVLMSCRDGSLHKIRQNVSNEGRIGIPTQVIKAIYQAYKQDKGSIQKPLYFDNENAKDKRVEGTWIVAWLNDFKLDQKLIGNALNVLIYALNMA